MISRGGLSALLFLSMLFAWAPPAVAQPYPSKPIKIIVPFPAGGLADIYSRILGNRLSETWGQRVVVENRTGAGGNIGADLVAKAPADGYTLGIGTLGTHAVNVTLFTKLPYDAVRDFAPIALILEAEDLLVVHPSVPVHSVLELIARARANPGALTFASAGLGTASHLAGELFKSMAKVEMVHVPYKGNVPAITDLLAGQTSLMFATMPTVLPQAKAGKLRALATIGEVRSAAAPELPTVAEAALPGFEVTNWIGLFAPAGTPPEIVRRLNAEVIRLMQSPEIRARMLGEGARSPQTTPEQFAAFVKKFVAYAKANPGKLNYASFGNHPVTLAIEAFNRMAGIEMVGIQFAGAAPMMTALLRNDIQFATNTPDLLKQYVDNRTIRILAATGKKRYSQLPDVPTVIESGYPDFIMPSWLGMFVRGGTPPELIDKMSKEIAAALQAPEVKARMETMGAVMGTTPGEMRRQVEREVKFFGDIAKAMNVERQ